MSRSSTVASLRSPHSSCSLCRARRVSDGDVCLSLCCISSARSVCCHSPNPNPRKSSLGCINRRHFRPSNRRTLEPGLQVDRDELPTRRTEFSVKQPHAWSRAGAPGADTGADRERIMRSQPPCKTPVQQPASSDVRVATRAIGTYAVARSPAGRRMRGTARLLLAQVAASPTRSRSRGRFISAVRRAFSGRTRAKEEYRSSTISWRRDS